MAHSCIYMYKCGNKLKLTSNVFRTLALHRRRWCGFVVFSTPPRALIPVGLGILSHICACACAYACVSQLLLTSFANARRNGHQRGRRFNLYMTSAVANLGLIRQCKLQQVRHDRCHPVLVGCVVLFVVGLLRRSVAASAHIRDNEMWGNGDCATHRVLRCADNG